MHEIEVQHKRTTGILSVILLFCVASFAIACGPVANGAPWVSLPGSAMDSADGVDRHAIPSLPKRPFVVVDWRSFKAALPHDDGKSKGALLPAGVSVAVPYVTAQCPSICPEAVGPSVPRCYGARAPPASI